MFLCWLHNALVINDILKEILLKTYSKGSYVSNYAQTCPFPHHRKYKQWDEKDNKTFSFLKAVPVNGPLGISSNANVS